MNDVNSFAAEVFHRVHRGFLGDVEAPMNRIGAQERGNVKVR